MPKIDEILKEKYVVKSKWKKNKVRGPVPKATRPREVIQMDTVDFGEVFAFTGVDIFTKEADVVMFPSLTSHDGLVYLETSMESFNRSLRKECLGWTHYKHSKVAELNQMVLDYIERYHYHRPHISLGMRPPLERI